MSRRLVLNWVAPPDVLAEELREALRAEMGEAVQRWHREMLPQHFREDSPSRYGFKPRSRRYLARKRRKFGHARMLVFYGGLERTVRRQIRVTVTKAGRTARGVMPLPPGVGAYRATSRQQFVDKRGRRRERVSMDYTQMGDEITRVSRDEGEFLAMMLQIGIQNRLNAVQTRRTEVF